MIVNSSQGGGSKDTWVLDDDEPGRPRARARCPPTGRRGCPTSATAAGTTRPSNSSSRARRGPAHGHLMALMLARIAQELFWLGRDLTRAEHTARILDGAFHADVAGGARRARHRAQLGGRAGHDRRQAAGPRRGGGGRRRRRPPPTRPRDPIEHHVFGRGEVARLLTLDTDSPASVVSCVARARERGRTMRDVISTEMWEALNSFYLLLGRYDLQAALRTGPYSVYQEVKEHCALFWGLVDRTMLRDEGRAFLEAGGPDRGGRHGPAHAPGGDPRRLARRGPRDRGAGAAARGRRLPGLPPRRPPRADGRARWCASCSSTPPIRARWPPRWTPSRRR